MMPEKVTKKGGKKGKEISGGVQIMMGTCDLEFYKESRETFILGRILDFVQGLLGVKKTGA